jgi:hypothetical protein
MVRMKILLLTILVGVALLLYAQEPRDFKQLKGAYLGQEVPGTNAEVFAPGIVSDSSWWEHCQVAISPGGDEIYWSAWTSKYPTKEGNDTEQIFYSKLENGCWTKPDLSEIVIGFLNCNNGGPVFSPDGNKLFFSSTRPGGIGAKDIWYVDRSEHGWSKPVNVGKPYNSTGNNDWTPVFTAKGHAYKMGWVENEKPLRYTYSKGHFSNPRPVIIHPDFHPWWSIYVSPDERYLIFSGYNYSQGFGNLDLYICFKTKKGKWGYPINMGNTVNSELTERFPVISPDGKYMFFVRHTRTQDFYWVSTAFFADLEKECNAKTLNPPPSFKPLAVSPEVLETYIGVYSGPVFRGKLIIFKEGNVLKYRGDSQQISPSYPLECYEKDHFRNDRNMVKFVFSTADHSLKIEAGKTYELTKE